MQPQLLQKRTDAKIAFGARPTIHCRRSLQGPWHGPSGTEPSSAIVSALPTIALATSAPIYLHLCSRTGARRPRCACARHKVQRSHILISKLRCTHSAHAAECVEGDLHYENVLPLYLTSSTSIAVLTGPSESPPKWSVYVMVSPALMAPTLVTASAVMAELGPVPLGPRQAVACAGHANNFRFVCKLRLQRAGRP